MWITMTSRLASFTDLLERNAIAVEATLVAVLADSPLAGETARPQRLVNAMRHATLDGGKRIRPFLMMESASLFGLPGEKVLFPAAALECLHSYSLAHDDLPAMDDDELRRGKPTVHIAYDEATAILAGDGLLTLAFDIMSREETHCDPAIRIELVSLLARAAGIGGMVGGQALDLAAETTNPDEQEIRTLQAMKTGALIRFATEAGAVLAGASARDRQQMVEFGKVAGRLFQLADDILDVEGEEQKMGKKIAKDQDRNKGTLVARLGIDAARKELEVLLAQGLDILAHHGERAEPLRQAAIFIAQRDR